MVGFITKKHVFTNFRDIYRLGGFGLIVSCLTAKPGIPFLTILAKRGF